ncbi:hypothetical protein PK35_04400 [Tamlana nanhaiensis]|uniref:Uncharacterized protein n=1 Tax=Neotamlana nanhaiensis TaxID=1382798 RepID=A0A0D7W5K8_9FLAO|nr:hypothetical protein [Tamlana nanhaiensis]KJD33983.1 hypothetical protein PK35_04400 [Tamlana nanhaiensis]
MVRIIGYKQREKEDGNPFFILELQGGVEMLMSKETGQFYATAKKAYVTSTFDEPTCKALIGTEMPGAIVKKEVEPYAYVVKETGEELVLTHRWVFVPEHEETTKHEEAVDQLMADTSVFSQNGVSDLAEQAI